jgi:hypothetical protein
VGWTENYYCFSQAIRYWLGRRYAKTGSITDSCGSLGSGDEPNQFRAAGIFASD